MKYKRLLISAILVAIPIISFALTKDLLFAFLLAGVVVYIAVKFDEVK